MTMMMIPRWKIFFYLTSHQIIFFYFAKPRAQQNCFPIGLKKNDQTKIISRHGNIYIGDKCNTVQRAFPVRQNPLFHLYRYNNPTLNKKAKKQTHRKCSTRKHVVVFGSNGLKWFKSLTIDENITAFNKLWAGLVLYGKIKMTEGGENKGRGRCKENSERC